MNDNLPAFVGNLPFDVNYVSSCDPLMQIHSGAGKRLRLPDWAFRQSSWKQMSGFSTLNQDWPILNLAVGLLLYSGCFAVGRLILSRCGGRGDSQSVGQHWCRPMICLVTGVALFCGMSNWLGWLQLANRPLLALWLSLWLGIGLLNLILTMRQSSFPAVCWPAKSDLLIIVPSSLLLVSASASSTKIDELYYHMLAPARFVLDGQLDFHQYPWQSALPQMYFQIGMSPLHAVGTPHAGNVLSACIGIQLAVVIRSLLQSSLEDRFFASLVAGLVLTGTHASVLYTTSGAHAVGDACLATVILMLAYSASRREQISAWHVGLLLSTAASTKVSLLPVAGVLSLLFLFRILRTGPRTRRKYLKFAVPWLLVCVPNFFWTWIESGSPFGPLLAGRFGPSVYDVERIQEVLSSSRMKARQFDAMLIQELAAFPLLFWFFVWRGLRHLCCGRRGPFIPVAAFVFQLAVLFAALPFAQRFLGGAQIALMVAGSLCGLPGVAATRSHPKRIRRLLVMSVIPWLIGQMIYLHPFVLRGMMLTSQQDFGRTFIPFYEDLLYLDRHLPDDATLFVTGVRPPSVYFPRPVFVHEFDDLEDTSPLFIFACDLSRDEIRKRLPEAIRLTDVIWENTNTLKYASRIPGRPARFGTVTVYRTERRQ